MRRLLQRCVASATVLLAAAVPASATWSIVVRNRVTGEMAVATSTCISGADIERYVPVIRVDYAAGAAQSFVNFGASNRRRIFRQSPRPAATPQALLDFIESRDSGFQTRQFGIVSKWGPPVTFTGDQCFDTALGVTGTFGDFEYAIQGNILTGTNVVLDCESALVNTPGDLGERLVAAMEAARDGGGDGRCSCSQGAPLSCGSPPASFTHGSTNVFMAIARPGDVDGVCTGALGCANGDYYARFNYVGTLNNAEPIGELRTMHTAWRQALVGRPDGVLSDVVQSSPRIMADGLTASHVTVQLRDVDGNALTSGGHAFTAQRLEGPAICDVQNVVDHGDGTYSFDLVATGTEGAARFALRFDDGVRQVQLTPALEIESVAPQAFLLGRAHLSAADPEPLVMVVRGDPADAGLPYRIFGSVSGTSPGTLVGPLIVPLNRDRLFDLTASWSGAPPFVGNAGLLDVDARALAELDLPFGSLTSFVGTTMHFAAVVDGMSVTNVEAVAVK